MKVTIIGTGYVGLVAGTCFADSGNQVICVDRDAAKIEMLKSGKMPIYEPGLAELVTQNSHDGRLSFSTDLSGAVGQSEVVFIAVGTPEKETGSADLAAVLSAAQSVGKALRQYTVVVDKSTVPVGTADKVRETIAAETTQEFDVVSNPEFLKEGAALEDFFRPDRVVVGTSSTRAQRVMSQLYAPFTRTGHPILFMDTRSAELTKYAANAMLATRISFMNDMASLCERVGADVEWVRQGLGTDKRIGFPFLFPGIGYGGSCFPKDVKALIATAKDCGLEFDLLRAVEGTNARQKHLLVEKALEHFGSVKGKRLAVWGLSFKPKTDDLREAPSLEIVNGLLSHGAQLACHDPVSLEAAHRHFGDRVTYCEHPYDAVDQAHGLFLLTEWNEYRTPDFERLKKQMKTRVLFDGRNIYDPVVMREHGFHYYGVGRPQPLK